MKKSLLSMFAAVFSLSVTAATSTPKGFTDDLDAAISASKASGKVVCAVFSGSDWCYWCKVLEEDHLSKKDFVNEASKNLELVFIDFPRDKSKLSDKARENNPTLMKKYGIKYFPTVMFIDQNGSATMAPRPAENSSPKDYAKLLAKEALSIAKSTSSSVRNDINLRLNPPAPGRPAK